MSELFNKIKKNSTIKNANILKNSKYFEDGQYIPTRIPLLNLALSGRLDGGIPPGIIQIAAPPKHFKTKFLHELMFAYQEAHKNDDYMIVLYDSELGSTLAYYEQAGIDTERVHHRPIRSVEELRSDIANLINDIDEGDNVFICIDSIGMLRSNKEMNDAINEKEAADMTRAKALNSLFRIITAESAVKRIPIAVINHSYQTQDMFPKEVASGGRKTQYAAHSLFFITKATERDADREVLGNVFTLRAGLSRYVKELSAFPVTALYEGGIDTNSGLFDLALESGHIITESKGWYSTKTGKSKCRRSDIEEDTEFFKTLIADTDFKNFVEEKYSI